MALPFSDSLSCLKAKHQRCERCNKVPWQPEEEGSFQKCLLVEIAVRCRNLVPIAISKRRSFRPHLQPVNDCQRRVCKHLEFPFIPITADETVYGCTLLPHMLSFFVNPASVVLRSGFPGYPLTISWFKSEMIFAWMNSLLSGSAVLISSSS